MICNLDLLNEIPLECNDHVAVIDKCLLLLTLLVAFLLGTSTLIHILLYLYSLIWMWYNTLHIYQSKLQFIKVNYNTSFTKHTKLAQLQVLRFWGKTWWGSETRQPLLILDIIMHSVNVKFWFIPITFEWSELGM